MRMRSEKGPRIPVTSRHKTKPAATGWIPSSMPKIAPAKAACDMDTPISGIFMRITKTERIEHPAPQRIQARRACRMGRYVKTSGRSIKGNKSPAIPYKGLERVLEEPAQHAAGQRLVEIAVKNNPAMIQ